MRLLIVEPTGENENYILFNFIDKSMFGVDPARPTTMKIES